MMFDFLSLAFFLRKSLFAGGEKKHDGSLTSPWQHLMVTRAFSILYPQQESTDEVNFRIDFSK